MHPEPARDAIRKGIANALKKKPPKKTKLPTRSPYRLDILLAKPEMADLCQMIPGIARKGPVAVQFKHDDFVAVYGAFLTIMRIAGTAVAD
jgi:D-aminopeptidase